MRFVARFFDHVPPVRHGRLVVEHVHGGVVTVVLPLAELIVDALVVPFAHKKMFKH
jgi:hypothetical protein